MLKLKGYYSVSFSPVSFEDGKENIKVLLILLFFSFSLTLIMGTDGWFRQPTLRGDSAWFFMCGKSWMTGLIPYQDFTDSKGPLLWLIYGLGFLISPHNFYGVFIFEVISYWLTFYIVYRIAWLITKNSSQALCMSLAMAAFYFFPGMHSEMRVEDFAHLFMAISFYVLLKTIYFSQYKNKYAFWLGIASGCTLLMKFSLFFIISFPAATVFIFLIVKRREYLRFLSFYICGLLLIALPFFTYFLYVGSFEDFINEYFINTTKTILNLQSSEETTLASFRHKWPYRAFCLFFPTHYLATFLRFTFIGLFVIVYLCRKNLWYIISLSLWYGFSMLLLSAVDSEFYFLPLSIFTIGIGFIFAKIFKGIDFAGNIMWGAIILALLTIISVNYRYSLFNYPERDRLVNNSKIEIAEIINKEELLNGQRPTILYYECIDFGEHILTNAVAGTKYWAFQAGMTDEMIKAHKYAIIKDTPDFIIIESIGVKNNIREIERITNEKAKEWNKLGYKLVNTYNPLPLSGEEEIRLRFLLSRQCTKP